MSTVRSLLQVPRLLMLALGMCAVAPFATGGTFGKVVSIGGQASDLALDETRGVLYISNFTANRVEVMSLADDSIQRSINVAAQPGSLAMSPDGKYLVVAHYGNFAAPNPSANAITIVNLATSAKQTIAMSSAPLAVAFGGSSRALVATASEFLLLDPATGGTQVVDTVSGVTAKSLPQPAASTPAQIVAASMNVSGDGNIVYGLTDSFMFRYDISRGHLRAGAYTAQPTMGPRAVSVSRDGSLWTGGWALLNSDFYNVSQFPNVTGALNIGSVLFDSQRNTVYAQMGETGSTKPVLQIVDADNLTVRERLNLQENLSGKSVLSAAGSTMYSVSESGVTVFPIGSLPGANRIVASKEILSFLSNACDRSAASQEITLTSDGANVDFKVTSDNPGVRVTPSSGQTPATVRVSVDPAAFQNQKGTLAVNLKIDSTGAVNQPPSLRVLINVKDPDQRGFVVAQPGKLVDVLADPDNDRFFVLRQDKNQVLVYDGTTLAIAATLRTYNTPKSMTITADRRYLLVGNDNSHFVNVFDLETLEPANPIRVADYVQSIAASANAILASTRSSSGGDNKIHRLDLATRTSTALPTLGVFENKIAVDTVMTATPNGRSILIAQSDGTLMLYDAVQDTFTVSRKEATPLTGGYAGSSFNQFVVGNALLNSSLVPVSRFDSGLGQTSGFAFVDSATGYRISSAGAGTPGVLERVELSSGQAIRPARTSEAPLTGSTGAVFTRTVAPLYSSSAIVVLTTSGFTVLPWEYDSPSAPPRIDRVVNAADFAKPVAPGGLVSVFGSDLSPVSQSSTNSPLPTVLGETCLTVNGTAVPVLFVSPGQINAQLPISVEGATTLVLRSPGGVSDNFNLTVLPAAPGVFRSGVAGERSDIATVIRSANNQLVTVSNPVHEGDVLSIYATGLGRTSPPVDAGTPAPSNPPAQLVTRPQVSLGGSSLEVLWAGLVPSQVGIYQIDVRVNGKVATGMEVPLVITQGGGSTSLFVRVVRD